MNRTAWRWITGVIFLVVFAVLVIGVVSPRPDVGSLTPAQQSQLRAAAFGGGFLALTAIWAAISFVRGAPTLRGIFNGEDSRPSTSKFQFFAWTVVAIFAYVALYAARILKSNYSPIDTIPANLIAAMGLSIGAALAAKGITQSRVDAGTLVSPAGDSAAMPRTSLGNLVAAPDGNADLNKIQVISWTLVALGVYLSHVWEQIGIVIAQLQPGMDCSAPVSGSAAAGTQTALAVCGQLPDVDTVLVVLTGLGLGTYVGTKLVTKATPLITAVVPKRATEGTLLTISGVGFGGDQNGSVVTVDGVQVTTEPGDWSQSQVKFRLPSNHPPGPWKLGDPIEVRVVVNGQTGAPYRLIYSKPIITGVTANKTWTQLVIDGSGFGTGQDGSRVTVATTDVAVDPGDWSETRISVTLPAAPPPGPWHDGDAVDIRVVADGQSSAAFQITYKAP